MDNDYRVMIIGRGRSDINDVLLEKDSSRLFDDYLIIFIKKIILIRFNFYIFRRKRK